MSKHLEWHANLFRLAARPILDHAFLQLFAEIDKKK